MKKSVSFQWDEGQSDTDPWEPRVTTVKEPDGTFERLVGKFQKKKSEKKVVSLSTKYVFKQLKG